jgi:hypothetical protein
MITPSSTVRFLNVPFSPSQNNVLTFPSVASQVAYMETKVVNSISGCTYIRESDGEYLRVNKVVDQLYNCNYVMFQNTQFGEKWFYAFIEKLKYKNGSVTDIILKMDVAQTFMFDYTIEETFIERQTPSEDYYNTLADTPSTGDLRTIWEYEKFLNGNYFILFNSDPTMDNTTATGNSYPIIGTYSMPCYMAICFTAEEMSEIVQAVSNKGRGDRIQACYFAPCYVDDTGYEIQLMPKGDLNITNDYIRTIHNMSVSLLSEIVTLNIGYTPTFKKELAYPYSKLEIVDRITGKSIELDLSKFLNPLEPKFELRFNITDNVEYKVIPINYNGSGYAIENSLVIEPNTDLPVFSNSYSKYLKDNKVSNILTGVMSVAGAIGSIAVDNPAGAVSSFASIANVINADSVAKKQPNQVSGIKGDAFEYMNYSPCIYFRLKVMDNEHMKTARNFWNAYGYPERSLGTFTNSGSKFSFLKTVGANIISDKIPSEYQREIENMLDKGVTFWKNDYLNYDIL